MINVTLPITLNPSTQFLGTKVNMTTRHQQIHHIGSETTFVLSDKCPLEELEVQVIERAKDGILQLRPDGIVWPPCNPGTVHQGVLKFENVGAGQRGQKLDARYPESMEDGV